MNSHKVIWHEGILLRPQHLQHSDRYHDQQMRSRTRVLGNYAWGFLTLDIDLQCANSGQLVIDQASGILPDGSLFELDSDTGPLAVEVPPNTCNVPVYLALPLMTGHHIEARRADQAEVLARYTAYEAQVADANAGDDGIAVISCGRPDFRLLLGEQQDNQAYVKLKVCQVLDTSADGLVRLDPDFVPTWLHVQASGFLLSSLREVISLLSHRGDAIAERIRSSGKAGGAEIGDFMMLQLINRTEPLLRHYLALEQLRPVELYGALLALLGELATFSNASKRPYLDNHYRHSDQGGCFRELMEAIRQVLSMVLEQHAIELVLQARDYGIAVAPLHDRKLLGTASFILAASASCDPEELRQRLPASLKIGPVESIRQLVNLHLPGFKIRPLPVAPRQIAFHANKTYFILDLSPEALQELERSGGFAFHVSGEFPGLELKFWAIRN